MTVQGDGLAAATRRAFFRRAHEGTIGMDFFADLRSEILRILPYDKSNPALVAELDAMGPSTLVPIYFNWRQRFVSQAPRSTHLSRELTQRAPRRAYHTTLLQIMSKIADGHDISPHLSRKIKCGYIGVGARKEGDGSFHDRDDLDLLLNDWGIHHLHLSTNMIGEFVERTGPLLFAIFTPSDAYLIDVLPHGSWTDERLIRLVVENWPDKELVASLNILSERAPSRTERKTLRGAGIATPVQIGQTLYMPMRGGGLTTAGTSTRAGLMADQFLKYLSKYQRILARDATCLRVAAKSAGLDLPDDPELRLVATDYGFGILETKCAAVFELSDFSMF